MTRVIGRSLWKCTLAVALIAAAVTAVAVFDEPAPSAAEPAAGHVVLIGFDGFDPDYLDRADTPNLDALAARGMHGVTQGVMMSITTPSFTSIVTGTWPDKHGTITYYLDRVANTFRTPSPTSTMPTIAEAVLDAGGTVGAAQYWAFRGQGADYGDANALYTQPGGACSNMFDDAISMLRQEPVDSGGTTVTIEEIPTLLGVYCPHLDDIGHDEGAESPNIGPALAELDAQVGRLMDTLEDVGIAEETTVIITGDHGMSTYTQRNTIPLNQALKDAGYRSEMMLLDGQQPGPETNVVVAPGAGRATSIYLLGDLAGDAEALQDIAQVALAVEGIERAFGPEQQAAMHMNPNFGDLVVESAPGWSTGVLPMTGPRGDHGSTDELDAAFFMAGPGVTAQADEVSVCHVNVAPTIAALLGLPPLADADGGAIEGDLTDLTGCPLFDPAEILPPTTEPTDPRPTQPPTAVIPGAAIPARPVRTEPVYTG